MDEQRVEVVEQALRDAGIEFERPAPGVFVAALPGERRLKTACLLTVGEHALTVEAFVMRHPEENHEQVYAYLLRHNARMYGVSWSIDDQGDVYLTGHVPLAAITPAETRPNPRRGAGVRRQGLQRPATARLRVIDQARVAMAGETR